MQAGTAAHVHTAHWHVHRTRVHMYTCTHVHMYPCTHVPMYPARVYTGHCYALNVPCTDMLTPLAPLASNTDSQQPVRFKACNLKHAHIQSMGGKTTQIGLHARPRWAAATAPLHTGADTCRTGPGAGNAPGQSQTRSVGGATTHGWRTRQAGESLPT